jgi:uncharacterized membrane protein
MNSEIPGTPGRIPPGRIPTARIPGHPFLRVIVSFPIACFCGALCTDIVYAVTADMIWADFSAWLLAIAMFTGVLAAIAGIVDVLVSPRVRAEWRVWPIFIGSLIVLVLGLFDNLVHSRDAWTSVMPTGLALSALTVVVMLVTAWIGTGRVYRQALDVPAAGVRE